LEISQTRSEKKWWLNLLNFGCHLLQNSLLGNIYLIPSFFPPFRGIMEVIFLNAVEYHFECPTLFQNVIPSVSFSIWETKQNNRGLSPASREDGE
jgi:hypothetical protein